MTLHQAIETAKAKAANHPEWTRAIEKAAKLMESGDLVVTLFSDNTALVTSPNGSYRVNGSCPCAARTSHCYHRAAVRLTEMMETAPVADERAQVIADIKATWPKSWPPLAVELMARFKKNSLEFLDDDMLRRVRLAIAA